MMNQPVLVVQAQEHHAFPLFCSQVCTGKSCNVFGGQDPQRPADTVLEIAFNAAPDQRHKRCRVRTDARDSLDLLRGLLQNAREVPEFPQAQVILKQAGM